MSNVLSEAKKQQVIALGRLGWPLRRIEQETGVRRETAGAYLKAAGIAVRPPGAWGRRPPAKPANENGVTTGSDAIKPTPTINPNPNLENLSTKGKSTSKPANEIEVTTGFGVESTSLEVENPKRIRSASACEPFHEAIELGLSRGRDATAIWQDLVAENGFDGGYQTVKRYVRKLRGNQPLQPRAVILTGPGEESQVDYGTGAMVRDPQSRKYRRTRLFVMVLGCSRKAARFLTFRSSSRIWAELHEKAFRRLGGATRVVVLDNLREGVLVPDIYDPILNPLYRDVLAHYGAVALPCRIKDPDRKEKLSRASATPNERSRENALRVWRKRKRIWTVGRQAVPIPAFMAPRNDKSPPCLPKKNLPCCRFPWSLFATTSESGWLRRSRSRLLRSAPRLDRTRSGGAVGCASRSHPRSQQRATTARARMPETQLVSH
jgi:transposase